MLARNYIRHNLRGDRREQNAVAKMAGGHVIPGGGRGPRMGNPSGVPGRRPAQSSIIFALRSSGTTCDRRAVQTLHSGDVGAFVEACFLNRGADDDSSVTARNQINLR